MQEIHQQAQHDNHSRDDIARDSDAVPEAVKLLIERSLHLVVDLRTTIHLTPFRGVADLLDHKHAMAFHDRAAATDVVRRIGGIRVEVLLVDGLAARGLTRQVRLIDAHSDGFFQRAVSRHLVARVEDDRVAHHNILTPNALYQAVTENRHLLFILALVQDVKFLVRTQLEEKAHRRGQHHRHEDTQRLKEHTPSLGTRIQLIHGHPY